jgi:hypothetical protein
MKKGRLSTNFILLSIIFLACTFRFIAFNWDQGYHLHPDERAIILKIVELQFPQNIQLFFSPNSPWNPHFFAYGNFPFYLLYALGQLFELTNYDNLTYLGRILSAINDVGTIILLFFLGKKLFSINTGLIAAFFYSIAVLPIQLSHFFAVDTLLTFLILATLYQLISFYEKPTIPRAVIIGLCFGLALGTKISALVLIVAIGAAIASDFLLLFFKQPHKPHHWFPHLPAFLKHLIQYGIIITATTLAIFLIIEPYALIDFPNFIAQTMQQSAMTNNAFTFPYTLQYVGKIPYLYELTNIFFFGLGPILAILSFFGLGILMHLVIQKNKQTQWAQETILLVFFITYFFIVGKFAIGFMRYMLPLYPLLCLFAAYAIIQLDKKIKRHIDIQKTYLLYASYGILYLLLLLYPFSFLHIYTKNNPRVDATTWIQTHIQPRKTIAVEHWDDQLPLTGSDNYTIETLSIYDTDTDIKWAIINQQLQKADYLIIASNRLYTPLQKLTNCQQLLQGKCYTKTAAYYQQLFSNKLGFQKVAEFTNYPTIPIVNLPLNDQWADESFTVYDHPKIMIFKKNTIPPVL